MNAAQAELLGDDLAQQARDQGAEYPVFAESTDYTVVIVDNSSGRTWKVVLVEF